VFPPVRFGTPRRPARLFSSHHAALRTPTTRHLAAGIVCAIAGVLALASPALAAKQYEPGVPASFGEEGSGPGQLEDPLGVAVNDESGLSEAAGDVYVVDAGNNRVERFSEGEVYLGQFNGSGAFEIEGKKESGAVAPTGAFLEPDGIAIDNDELDSSVGDVYVADNGHQVIDEFSATGKYEGQRAGTCERPEAPPCSGSKLISFGRIVGLTVDASGDLWVYESREGEGWVDEFTSDGTFTKTFATHDYPYSGGIAVGAGNIIIGDGNEVLRYEAATGDRIASFYTHSFSGQGVRALTLDPVSNDLLLDDNESGSELQNLLVVYGPFGEPYSAPLETFPAEPLSQSYGVAIGGTGTAYVTLSTADTVRVFEHFQPPTTEAAGVTEAAITLHGTAYPEGETITACRFEYGYEAGSYESSVPCTHSTPFGGSEPVSVQASVTSLEPHTTYHFRLVTQSSREKDSGDDSFFTSTKPVITEEKVTGVGSNEATVTARLDAAGLSTGYWVEYGPTAGYGSATVAVELGAPERASSVSVRLSNLSPGTEYHFRVVATNSLGSGEGADSAFSTAGATLSASVLPDDRAYELISTSPTVGELYVPSAPFYEGEDDQSSERPFQAAEDGEAITYVATPSATGGSGGIGNGLGSQWLASRASGQWQAADITPVGANDNSEFEGFSSSLSLGIERSEQALTDGAVAGCLNLYARSSSDGAYSPVLTSTATPGECGRPYYAGATPDFSQVLVQSEAALTEGGEEAEEGEYPHAAYGEGCQQDCNLYDSAGSVLRPVNVLPDGVQVPNAAFGGPSKGPNPPDSIGDISEDGSRAFWSDMQPGADEDHIYMRINPSQSASPLGAHGECTVASDACTVAVSTGAAAYWGATPDGRYAYYVEAGKLWRYDSETQTRQLVVGEGVKSEPARVQGVLGMNQVGEDGAYVYIIAEAALAPGAKPLVCRTAREEEVDALSEDKFEEEREEEDGLLPAGRGCNLYLLHAGETPKLVATLSPTDDRIRAIELDTNTYFGDWRPDLGSRTSEVTPDGHAVLFESNLSLTGYDNKYETPSETRYGAVEAFVYSTESSGLSCASCDPAGAPPQSANRSPATLLPATLSGTHGERWMSDNGSRVFFTTFEALVPQDSNGVPDVYEWEREGVGTCPVSAPALRDDGCVSLLSGGESSDYSFFGEADAEGNNVFIMTRSQLVPQDRDDKMDLYDVRVDGGSSEATLACTGTGCQGVPPAAPSFATPSSVTFTGTGNFAPATSSVKPKSAAQIRAEDLSKALKKCRAKHNRHKRKACEGQARKRYGPPQHKVSKAKKSSKHSVSSNQSRKGRR